MPKIYVYIRVPSQDQNKVRQSLANTVFSGSLSIWACRADDKRHLIFRSLGSIINM